MSLDGGILNLTNWAGNVIMPTLAGLFGAAAIYRFGKAQPWQHRAWAGLASLMCSGLLRVLEGFSNQAAWNDPDRYWLAVLTLVNWVAVQAEGQFVQMRQVFQLPVSSATLPTSQQLEQSLLSRNPAAVAQISNDYSALYGPVTAQTDAPQPIRDLVDMTDAAAQAAMKRAVEIDALADLELQAAEEINRQLQAAAPGSADILEAQTSAWLVRANAYTQSAMAELIRVRSIELANEGARLKFSTSHTSTLHSTGGQVLQQGVR